MFDANSFMQQNVDAQLDTTIALPPEGDYRAMFGDIHSEKSFRTFTSDKNGKDYTLFEPSFALADDPRLTDLDREQVYVRHKGVFLDLDDSGQGLATSKGKNVDLGRMRDAVGQNIAGQPWNFSMLSGAGPVMVHVIHEADKNDNTKKYARVNRVVKIG